MRTHQQPWDGLHWRRRGLLAFVVATVGVTACSGGNNGRDCTSTSSCPSGFLCVAQQCVQICAADHECGADRYCVAGTCQAIECEVDADCQSPAVCERLEDAICVSGACRYEPATAQDLSCDDGNQCTNDDSCSAGRCVGVPRVCNEPPASSCTDNNRTYLTYDSTGNCDATSGACQYAPVPIACENCTANCLGQCGGITCPTQNGGCRIQGTCNPSTGSCDYTTASEYSVCDLPGSFAGAHDGECQSGSCLAISYQWETSAWGSCSASCGAGTQSRTVTCIRSRDAATMADSQCSGSKPATSQSCTGVSSCDCTWQPGPAPAVANGGSVTAFQSPSVGCGQSCVSQVRVCNQGVLSGSFTYSSCVVEPCGPQIVLSSYLDGPSATAFNRSYAIYIRVYNLTATNAQSCMESVGYDDGVCASLGNWTTMPANGWAYDSAAQLWRATLAPYAFPARTYRGFWRNTLTGQQTMVEFTLTEPPSPGIVFSASFNGPAATTFSASLPFYGTIYNLNADNAQSCLERVGYQDGYCSNVANYVTMPNSDWSYDAGNYVWRATVSGGLFPPSSYWSYWRNSITGQISSVLLVLN